MKIVIENFEQTILVFLWVELHFWTKKYIFLAVLFTFPKSHTHLLNFQYYFIRYLSSELSGCQSWGKPIRYLECELWSYSRMRILKNKG
jgi:hypothetical protein